MTVHATNQITSNADYIQALIVCWASSGKPDLDGYAKGFVDAHLGSGLISQEQAASIKRDLVRQVEAEKTAGVH